MINDIREIIGIIFMMIVGIIILNVFSNTMVGSFAVLGIIIIVIAGLATILAIIYKLSN